MRLFFFAPLLVACAAAPVAPKSEPLLSWDVEGVSGLGLFADERAQSRDAVSEALRKLGKPTADGAMMDRAWALAGAGKNPLTGADCGRPLAPYDARKRWGRALGLLGHTSASVWCPKDKPCELSVYASRLDEDGERFEFDATIEREGAPLMVLQKALTTLAPPPPSEGGVGGILGSLGGSQGVQTEDLLHIDVDPADNRAAKQERMADAFTGVTAAQVMTCFGPQRESVSLLMEFASTGAVSRCEADHFERVDNPVRCTCELLARATHSAALNAQRWSVDLRIDRKDQLTRDGKLVLTASWNTRTKTEKRPGEKYPRMLENVEDASLEGWFPGPGWLVAGCFANRTEPAKINSRWAVWFDAQGNAMKAAEQKGWPPLDAETSACVANALRTAQAPCPSRANLWAIANLHVNLRDPNAPEKSPFEDALLKK